MKLVNCTLGLLAIAAPAGAGVAEDASAVREGEIRLTYEARADVWGDGHNLSINNDGDRWFQGDDDGRELTNGPVRVSVFVHRGEVREVETKVGGRWRSGDDEVVDLGRVDPVEAAAYLVGVARRSTSDRVADDAVLGAVVAKGAVVWPDLVEMARDPDMSRNARERAVFWLAQAAGEAVLRGHENLDPDDPEIEVKEQAVFAISQRSKDRSIPALMDIAEHHSDPRIRRRAIFWLGQEADPRAVDLFASILREE